MRALAIILAFFTIVEFASAADKCPAAAANDVEEGYNSALSDKRDALEEGKRQLSQIREELERDSNGIGKPGGAKQAAIAIALIARETTDLMEFMGAIFEPGGTAVQREFLKKLKKLRKDVEPDYHAAEKIINDDARDVIDQLPSFVPGVKLTRDSKQWDAAKNEFSLQLANLDRAIDKLDQKVADLAGPNRASSIEDILRRAQARRQQCVDELAERERKEQISCEVSCDHWFRPDVLGKLNRECRQDCDHAHPANRTP